MEQVETMGKTDAETHYNGWKNWETWNVSLWLANEYALYNATRGFAGYKTPYLSLRQELRETFDFTRTKDGASLWDPKLDIDELNEMIEEMAE